MSVEMSLQLFCRSIVLQARNRKFPKVAFKRCHPLNGRGDSVANYWNNVFLFPCFWERPGTRLFDELSSVVRKAFGADNTAISAGFDAANSAGFDADADADAVR